MNRRRHDNVIQFVPILTWVLLAAFACGGGLFFVSFKNQAHKRAEKISALQKTLDEIKLADEAVKTRISALASPNQFRKLRLTDKSFLAGYVEVTSDHLVVLGTTPGRMQNELQPVSNEQR